MNNSTGGKAWWWAVLLRFAFVVVALAAWFWTQSLIGERPAVQAIGDGMHDLLAGPHAYLKEHGQARDLLLIVSSFVIDLLGIFLLASSIFGRSLRPFVALLLVFGMRQICQLVCPLPEPVDGLWRRPTPAVPSLLVTYHVSTDFFFSGHTALAVLGAVEIARLGGWRWLCLGWLIIVFESSAVLVLRAHYTMDVFTGIIAAHYAAILASWWAPWLDQRLVGTLTAEKSLPK